MKKGNKKILLIVLVVGLIAGFAFFSYKTDLLQGSARKDTSTERKTSKKDTNSRDQKAEVCEQWLVVGGFNAISKDIFKLQNYIEDGWETGYEDYEGSKIIKFDIEDQVEEGDRLYLKAAVEGYCFDSFDFSLSYTEEFSHYFDCSDIYSYKMADIIYPYFYCDVKPRFIDNPPNSASLWLNVQANYLNDKDKKMNFSHSSPAIHIKYEPEEKEEEAQILELLP